LPDGIVELAALVAHPVVCEVLGGAGEGLLVVDSRFCVAAAGRFCLEAARGAPARAGGRSLFEWFPSMRMVEIQSALWQVMAGRTCSTAEFPHQPGAGRSSMWLTACGAPLRNAQGDVAGALLLVREVTAAVGERRRVEAEALRWQRMASLMGQCARALWRCRDEVQFLREACDILVRTGGYAAVWGCLESAAAPGTLGVVAQSELGVGGWGGAGRSIEVCPLRVGAGRGEVCRITDPLTGGASLRCRKVSLRGGEASVWTLPLSMEGRVLGALHGIEGAAGPVTGRDGGGWDALGGLIGGGIGWLQETARRRHSERTRTEQDQRQARERLDKLFESSPVAMAVLAVQEDRVLEANGSLLQLLGRDRRAIIGHGVSALGAFGSGTTVRSLVERYSGAESPGGTEVSWTAAGRVRQALVSVDRISGGAQPSALLTLVDVTDRKQLEAELRESQKLEAIGHLARGVAHDFNNILTVIQGHQHLIQAERRLPPKAADSVAQIGVAAERAAELTRQLLTFSRRQPLEARLLDMNEVIGRLTQMLRRVMGEDIRLRVFCSRRACGVMADAGMMEQVLLNLAVNARDAMPHGGCLTVRTEHRRLRSLPPGAPGSAGPGSYVALTVRDTGDGIPPENLERIFEPFFTTKSAGKGTGLGLATVRSIVEQHGGWIEVESRLSGGTAFRVLLPRAGGRLPVSNPAGGREAPRGGGETVLLVEDESPVRALARSALERQGYRVLAASEGNAALRLWQRKRSGIDLLLTDVVMPGGMDGRELARRLRMEAATLPVLLTTGYAASATGGREGGLEDAWVLQKPYSPDQLVRCVRDCLDAARAPGPSGGP